MRGTVRRHGPRGDFRVILIDDASPDPRIGRYFDLLAEEGDPSLLLLRNSENLGFSGTANRGMCVSDERDVVLLNSDTLVTAGWLEKIRRCADSDPRIGTITPFSNNATICSFPKFGEAVPLSALPPIEMVSRAIEDAAVPCYPDLPCAVGFCMFIRRDVIRTIGLLDAETFGRGFGEDNDYSMRVARAGYRNVLCDDTFVAHTGSSSFGDAKDALVKLNTQRLVMRYPEYPELVRAFIADNPVRAIITAAAIRLACIEGAGKPGVVHILHGDPGGGTRSHVQDLVRAGSRRLRQYLLVATGSEWTLEIMDGHGDPIRLPMRRGDGESWADVLDDLFSFLEIDVCHVHEISTARDGLLQALASLQVPYGVTLHNYYLACPTTTLLDGAGEYCGAQTDNGLCQRCLQDQPPFRGIAIADWRNQHAALLKRARFVVAPARAVADTLRRYFPDLCMRVIPHGIGRAEIQVAATSLPGSWRSRQMAKRRWGYWGRFHRRRARVAWIVWWPARVGATCRCAGCWSGTSWMRRDEIDRGRTAIGRFRFTDRTSRATSADFWIAMESGSSCFLRPGPRRFPTRFRRHGRWVDPRSCRRSGRWANA